MFGRSFPGVLTAELWLATAMLLATGLVTHSIRKVWLGDGDAETHAKSPAAEPEAPARECASQKPNRASVETDPPAFPKRAPSLARRAQLAPVDEALDERLFHGPDLAPETSWITKLVVVAALGALLWWAFKPRFDFTIRRSGSRVAIWGRLPEALHGEIAEFFRKEIDPGKRVGVSGRRLGKNRYTFTFHGALDIRERQRIRNFLTLLLG